MTSNPAWAPFDGALVSVTPGWVKTNALVWKTHKPKIRDAIYDHVETFRELYKDQCTQYLRNILVTFGYYEKTPLEDVYSEVDKHIPCFNYKIPARKSVVPLKMANCTEAQMKEMMEGSETYYKPHLVR